MITQLIDEIIKSHYPYGKGSPDQVRIFEQRSGYRLPYDMQEFYHRFEGARLFQQSGTPYHILPIANLRSAAVHIFGADSDEEAPTAWYAFCDVQDGNYLAVDLSSVEDDNCDIRDCFHETFPDSDIVAKSFTEFLLAALKSSGRQFWLT